MAKYIDRDALVEWLKRIPLKDLSDGLGLCRVIMEDDFKKAIKKMPKGIIVDVAPTVDAVPVRHGHWIMNEYDELYCSVCGDIASLDSGEYFYRGKIRFDDSFYCPNCGAKMDEKVSE